MWQSISDQAEVGRSRVQDKPGLQNKTVRTKVERGRKKGRSEGKRGGEKDYDIVSC